MPFGQVPTDDEVPAYSPFRAPAPAAAAPPQPVAAPAQPQVPYYVASPQVAAPPQGQAPPPQAAPVQGQPQPAVPAVVLPTAPQAPAADLDKWHALEAQLQKDSAPVKVSPKWYERLGGAAVGFGAGYKGGAAEGIRAGSAVTNRGQIQASEEQAAKVAGDRAAMDSFKEGQGIASHAYEDQVRQFGAEMQGANAQREQTNADRSFKRETDNDARNQSNADRSFKRETDNDARSQSNADRGFDESKRQFDVTSSRAASDSAEHARHDRADEGIASMRERREADAAAGNPGKGKYSTVTPSEWQALLKERDADYDKAGKEADENGSSPAERKQLRDTAAAELQKRWNERLATADPTGRYAQQAQPPAVPPRKVTTIQGPNGPMKVYHDWKQWFNADTNKPL